MSTTGAAAATMDYLEGIDEPELDLIYEVYKKFPDLGMKKLLTKLKEEHYSLSRFQNKALREVINFIKDREVEEALALPLGTLTLNVQDFSKYGQLSMESESATFYGPISNDHLVLHDTLLNLTSNMPKFIKNLQATLQILDGRFGDYEFTPNGVANKVKGHFFYGMGNTRNTPPESCKLTATIMRVLCSKPNKKDIAAGAVWCSMSAGAFAHLKYEKPNKGVFLAALKSAEEAALGPTKQSTLVSCQLSDLFVIQNPYFLASFAHSFSVAVFPTEDKVSARIYQAFGPPDIGYSIQQCLNTGTGSRDMSTDEWANFKKNYDLFENSKEWNSIVEKAYQSMFACKLKLRPNYPLLVHTSVHSDVIFKESVESNALLLYPPSI